MHLILCLPLSIICFLLYCYLFFIWIILICMSCVLTLLFISDMDSSSDSQLPFIPSTEVLVKCLFFIAPYAVVHSPRLYSRIILCSHHPCLSSSSNPASVYKVWILLAIFYQIIFMSDWFHQISEVAKKAETRTDFLCWLNYPQHLCYLQGNSKTLNFFFKEKVQITLLKFDLCPDVSNNLFQLSQFTP
jgi:hypothetical protein